MIVFETLKGTVLRDTGLLRSLIAAVVARVHRRRRCSHMRVGAAWMLHGRSCLGTDVLVLLNAWSALVLAVALTAALIVYFIRHIAVLYCLLARICLPRLRLPRIPLRSSSQ
jgi:hypothetical protein